MQSKILITSNNFVQLDVIVRNNNLILNFIIRFTLNNFWLKSSFQVCYNLYVSSVSNQVSQTFDFNMSQERASRSVLYYFLLRQRFIISYNSYDQLQTYGSASGMLIFEIEQSPDTALNLTDIKGLFKPVRSNRLHCMCMCMCKRTKTQTQTLKIMNSFSDIVFTSLNIFFCKNIQCTDIVS